MATPLKVSFVRARCSRTKADFTIRFSQTGSLLVGDAAFPLSPENAQRKEFGAVHLEGQIQFASSYPGCPGCKAKSMYRCGCGKVGCWDTKSSSVTCPWCGSTGVLQGVLDSLNVVEDF